MGRRRKIRYGPPACLAMKLFFTSGRPKKMSVIKKNTWILLVAGFAVLIAVGVITS
jgi:hypothetical protein